MATEQSDRTIACADRVIYRPTANDEDQVTAAIPSSRTGTRSNLFMCGSARSGRRCLARFAMFILVVLLAAVLLETIHYFHRPCE